MKKQTLIWVIIGLAITVAIITWLLAPFETKQSPRNSVPPATENTSAATIAEAWEWDAFSLRDKVQATEMSESTGAQASGNVQFDVARIYNILAKIKLDDSGHIILDSTVLDALQQALMFSDVDWTPENLAKFKAIVQSGLPGPAGDQSTQLIDDFHQYANAKDEFEAMIGPGDESIPIDQYAEQYQELTNLRELYLGKETADRLFAKEAAEAKYMLESIRLAKDPDISEEERRKRQAELATQLDQREPNIPQWQSRYQAFQQEKQAIQSAGISEADKKQQLEALVEQHFDEAERAQAEHLKLDEF